MISHELSSAIIRRGCRGVRMLLRRNGSVFRIGCALRSFRRVQNLGRQDIAFWMNMLLGTPDEAVLRV